MLTHVKTIHLKAKKKCLECNKFFSLGGYPTHMRNIHGEGKMPEPMQCEKCSYSTVYQVHFRKHYKKMKNIMIESVLVFLPMVNERGEI